MNIVGCGYRDWALEIFRNIGRQENVNMSVLTSPSSVTPSVLDGLRPDLVLFYGWSWIVPRDIVEKYLCLCLHPSPLPEYRGGSPLQHQILANERMSAVSIFRMAEEMDTGPLCFRESFSLDGTMDDIFRRITFIGIRATKTIISKLRNDSLRFWPQKTDGEVKTHQRRKPHESEITIDEIRNSPARCLHNKIRALADPYPNAFIVCGDGRKLYLTKAFIEEGEEP